MDDAGSSRVARIVRDADWLTADRASAWCRILLGLLIAVAAAWVATARDGVDLTGKPLGTDFVSFWAASKIALGGHPLQAYDVAVHASTQRAMFKGADTGYFAFFYPPNYLLLCLPLALLPYGSALTAWLAATGLAYYAAVRRLLGPMPHGTLAILAFPAVALDCGHGQNALLATALFATAILLSRRGHRFAAGVAFGLLAFKPHLGLMIPIFLVGTGAWLEIAAAAATVVATAGAAALAFGPRIYTAFLDASALARSALEHDLVGAAKMQSAYASVQLWHGPAALAWAVQGVTALGAAVALAAVTHLTVDKEVRAASLVCASLLGSPFLLDYDLTLLAIPLALMTRRGLSRGFQPYEKIVLFVAFILPLVSRTVATAFGLSLGPPTIGLLFALVVRAAATSREEAPLTAAATARACTTAAQQSQHNGMACSRG